MAQGSRLKLDTEKLVSLGWKVEERESLSGGRRRVILTFEDPDGKTFKSAKDVERILRQNGLWEKVQCLEKPTHPPTSDAGKPSGTRSVTGGTRLNFDLEKLVSLGWKLFEWESGIRRKRTIISFQDPYGKKYKSGKDVEKALKEKGSWEQVKNSEDEADDDPDFSIDMPEEKDTDPNGASGG